MSIETTVDGIRSDTLSRGKLELTVASVIRYGQQVRLECVEAKSLESQRQVLCLWRHGDLEGQTQDVEGPENLSI